VKITRKELAVAGWPYDDVDGSVDLFTTQEIGKLKG